MIRKGTYVGLIGFLLTIVSVPIHILGPRVRDIVKSSLLILAPNTTLYQIWKDMPIPTSSDIYIFNWTNVKDIYNNSIKPRFEEIGPYRFWETREKIDISWNENGTVTYRQVRHYFYDEDGSNGTLSDTFTTLDTVVGFTAYISKGWGFTINKAIETTLEFMGKGISMSSNVADFLCNGIEDPLVNLAPAVTFITGMPEMPFDKFGILYIRNGSTDFDGTFNVGSTGDRLGEILQWNYSNKTDVYKERCGEIHGSAGELYHTPVKRDKIEFFLPEVCRSITLHYEQDVVVKGITGYKFVPKDMLLDNGTLDIGNKCYCNDGCIPSGMLGISKCRYGIPMFLSFPHYYKADPTYLNAVEGLKPNPEKHDFYVVIEPNLGVPLDVKGGFQINFHLQPLPDLSLYDNVPDMYFPIMWIQLTATLPDDYAGLIRNVVNIQFIATVTAAVFGFSGISLILFGFWSSSKCKNGKGPDTFIAKEQEPCIKK